MCPRRAAGNILAVRMKSSNQDPVHRIWTTTTRVAAVLSALDCPLGRRHRYAVAQGDSSGFGFANPTGGWVPPTAEGHWREDTS